MNLADEDRNTYNDVRPVFISACPDCGAELDEDNRMWSAGYIWRWYCGCGRIIEGDEVYTI